MSALPEAASSLTLNPTPQPALALQVQWEVAAPMVRPAFKLELHGELGVASKLQLHKRLLNPQRPYQLDKHGLVGRATWHAAA